MRVFCVVPRLHCLVDNSQQIVLQYSIVSSVWWPVNIVKCSFLGFLLSNKQMSSLALDRIMNTLSYRNFNLFKQHLGMKERHVDDTIDKDAIFLPLLWVCHKRAATLSSRTVWICYVYQLIIERSWPPDMLIFSAASSLYGSLFLVQPYTPTSLCLTLRQSVKCVLVQSFLSFDLQACRFQSWRP